MSAYQPHRDGVIAKLSTDALGPAARTRSSASEFERTSRKRADQSVSGGRRTEGQLSGLGHRDHQALGTADAAESAAVVALHDVVDELSAVGAQAREHGVEAADGEQPLAGPSS